MFIDMLNLPNLEDFNLTSLYTGENIRLMRLDNGRPGEPLCFAAVYFFFYSARILHGLSADRRKTLPHDRKWVQF